MINRILIRIKTIQLLYAYRINKEQLSDNITKEKELSITAKKAETELLDSLNQTYELYHWILQLIVELHAYAIKRIEIGLNKLRPTEEERNPNKRFINNLFRGAKKPT